MELGLKGKVAIVTGGGSNIGRGIALALGGEGVNVVVADLDEVQGKKVADMIKGLCIKTDATSLESVEAMVKKTLEKYGKIDILVNNLGWDKLILFMETTPDFWAKLIDINFKSNMYCTKTVLAHMIERKSGRIINIGSDAARVGQYKESVYAGTKGGIIALSKSIAQEVGRYGITVNVVCPGLTLPKSNAEEASKYSMWSKEGGVMANAFTPETLEKAAKAYPLRRVGTPEDIAHAVVFFASDAANFITGQTLSVNGGYSMV